MPHRHHHHHHHHSRTDGPCTIHIDDYWDTKPSINGNFERGIYGCCEDPGNCIFGLFFPCILDGIIACGIGS
jgi:hypothetical protein